MTKRTLPQKFLNITHEDVVIWISRIFKFGICFLLFVFGMYLLNLNHGTFSQDPAVWGQFGDYIGGVANPILSFLTLIGLILTIVIQSRQLSISSKELDLSRKELELTREELVRSANAQELSELALRDQVDIANKSSRLNTISFLLDYYSKELSQLNQHQYPRTDTRFNLQIEYSQKYSNLHNMLNSVYDDLIDISGNKNE